MVTLEWPTLSNGAVDWFEVFQNPENGLKVNVARAKTSEKLHAVLHVVVNSLFARESDATVRAAFIESIDALFVSSGDNLEGQKAKMNLLLGRIMYDRMERAKTYARHASEQKGERLDEDDPLQALEEIK